MYLPRSRLAFSFATPPPSHSLRNQTTAQKAVEEAERKKNALFRADVEDLCKRRFIFINSFEIYGGARMSESARMIYRIYVYGQ